MHKDLKEITDALIKVAEHYGIQSELGETYKNAKSINRDTVVNKYYSLPVVSVSLPEDKCNCPKCSWTPDQ